jgi:phosphatidylglycerol lysyltransferase
MKPDSNQISLWLNRLMPVVGIALFAVALAVVHHTMQEYRWSQIREAIAGLPLHSIAAATAMSLLGYLALTFYDWLALEYCGEKLPYRRVALAAFLSYAVSNNVGHALISGGSMRYRLYSGWGVPPATIAKVVVFCALTYIVGAVTLFVGAAALTPTSALAADLPTGSVTSLLVVAVLGLAAWWSVVVYGRGRQLIWRGFRFELPTPSLCLRQTLVAVVDLIIAGLVLYLLLGENTVSLSGFMLIYIVAQLLGLISQVPGGLGVFESTVLVLGSNAVPPSQLLAALIAYRVIYYFVPLALAGLVLLAYEIRQSGILQKQMLRSTLITVDAAMPQIFSVLLLLGGAVLLVSGATPAEAERLRLLKFFVPLPVMELSHMAGSIAGVALLLLANAVRHRIDSAYYATLAVLAIGIVASLVKGFDYEEAAALTVMLAAFLPTHKHFYRRSSLLDASLPPQWYLLVVPILIGTTWLGFFSYKHIEYSGELWWDFSLHGNASRFLRSLFASTVLLCTFFGYRLLTRISIDLKLPSAEELSRAAALARRAEDATAYLALTGDKYLLWSDSGNSFIMFDVINRNWIVMGDPVGDPAERTLLIWKFRELADRNRARVAFYQVGKRNLSTYVDLGMTMLKLGEEARVYLAGFNLQGKRRSSLRTAYNKAQREGLVFEVISGTAIDAAWPQLAAISAGWLQTKGVREKRFSVGFFAPDYLRRCRIAIIRQEQHILAFANLWELDNREELSVDLMRHAPDSPNGVMEFLFTSLLLWGQEQGYLWFNLGMAPLSGLEKHPLAPVWHKVGNTIYRLGRDFYNFDGLYQYKNKFDPVWHSRYLAVAPGLPATSALLATTQLISGGVKGMFTQ